MATEIVTLGDIRAAAKVSGGILAGGWESGDPNPLIEPLQEMADDITKWFNPDQRWRLVEVRTGLINPQRIAKSVDEFSGIKFRVKKQEVDQFTPFFHFEADKPPMKRSLMTRRQALDFPRVFAPDFRHRVIISHEGFADVIAEKIGTIYPLEKALKEVSSPYYLVGATVYRENREKIREISRQIVSGLYGRPMKPLEPARDLAVIVYMRDLIDQTRSDVNRLRRVQRQLNEKFPPLQSI